MNTPLVRLRSVSVVRQGRPILANIDLELYASCFLGIVGPNGAGKSTLIGLLNGFVLPDTGSVEVFGESLTARTAVSLRRRIGYVAQWQSLDPRQPISVFESVLSGSYGRLGFFTRPGVSEQAAADEALEAVGLTALRNSPLGQLSGGEAQRAAIARALVQKPELLLLDEPTASLDWQARRDVLSLVEAVRERYKLPVIMVTHALNVITGGSCEQVLMLKDGAMLWYGSAREAMQETLLSELYGIPVEIISHGGRTIALL